jgi:hypothetical protein
MKSAAPFLAFFGDFFREKKNTSLGAKERVEEAAFHKSRVRDKCRACPSYCLQIRANTPQASSSLKKICVLKKMSTSGVEREVEVTRKQGVFSLILFLRFFVSHLLA